MTTATSGPRFVQYFGPVLRALVALGGSARPPEVCEHVADATNATEAQLAETLSNGSSRVNNQVAWARFYLAKAGLVDASTRGVWAITEAGRQNANIGHGEAMRIFSEVHGAFQASQRTARLDDDSIEPDSAQEPDGYRATFLRALLDLSPSGFERFAMRLLRESGFQTVVVTGRSGDGGIDGVGLLQLNPLVSTSVLYQCKRYDGHAVGSGAVRDFRGAMAGRSDSGIIITTGTFTSDARKEAVRDGVPPIELVDGERLVDLCEQLQLGLKPRQTFDIDSEFFEKFTG